MHTPIQFAGEAQSNEIRTTIATQEAVALRTFTPSQGVLARSAGVFHHTPEGRRLYDYTSGVLVANLGHNPRRWLQRFAQYMAWTPEMLGGSPAAEGEFVEAVTMTAYNAITPVEAESVRRLVQNVQSWPGGRRLDTVMWAASGSEAIQKALWACLHRDHARDLILATRHGFHGKKGLAGAVTGSEADPERDPRVKFISFPRQEVDDVSKYGQTLDLAPYAAELKHFGRSMDPASTASSPSPIWAVGAATTFPRPITRCCGDSAMPMTSYSSSMRCRRISGGRDGCSRSKPVASNRISSCWGRGWGMACRCLPSWAGGM